MANSSAPNASSPTPASTQDWTRQQAIDYGISPAETERYVMNPGQACAYKIGMLKILGLRAKAQKALGGKFSLKEFHNTVLQTGNVPLAVLEQVIEDRRLPQVKMTPGIEKRGV